MTIIPFTALNNMITPKEAAQAARNYLKDFMTDQELPHLRVEEISLAEDKKVWKITLGWVEQANRNLNTSGVYVRGSVEALPRVYKDFEVDAETGEVASMKMRD